MFLVRPRVVVAAAVIGAALVIAACGGSSGRAASGHPDASVARGPSLATAPSGWKGLAVPCPANGGAQLLASTGTAVLWTVCGGNNPAGQRLLTSSDAGTTWTASPILPKPNPTQSVQAIAPTGPSSGYLQADDQQIWATTDNGQHWNVSYQSPPGADNFPYMLGVEDSAHAHFLSLHAVHSTSDGGHSWTAVTFP